MKLSTLGDNFGWKCWYCNCRLRKEYGWQDSITRDHFVPRSRGGTDSYWNIVAACRRCNWERGVMDAMEFRQQAQDYSRDSRPMDDAARAYRRAQRHARLAAQAAAKNPPAPALHWWERVWLVLNPYVVQLAI